MVKVMVGSLLLASFLYTAPIQAGAASYADTQAKTTQSARPGLGSAVFELSWLVSNEKV
jgi:hypothetical protein